MRCASKIDTHSHDEEDDGESHDKVAEPEALVADLVFLHSPRFEYFCISGPVAAKSLDLALDVGILGGCSKDGRFLLCFAEDSVHF